MRKATNKNWQRVTAAAAALALCAGVLTGCGASSSTAAGSTAASSAAASEVSSEEADEMAAKNVADLIDAIYVQERSENTDAQCEAAKAAWDALTDAQKEMVEGEEASPEYFGRDTGDASKDDARNGDNIGDNEILVVSFGTSFNDSRAADILPFYPFTFLFLYASGVMPERCLKKLVRALWSLKLRWVAISPMVMSE